MKYKVYISQVWTYTTEIEAESRTQADEIAEGLSAIVSPRINNPARKMVFGDTYVEVEPIKEDK